MSNPYAHEQGDPTVKIQYGNRMILGHVNNAFIYEHPTIGQLDHIFAARKDSATGVQGQYIWKLRVIEQRSLRHWNTIVTRLGDIGCHHFVLDEAAETDKVAYEREFGEPLSEDQTILPEISTVELTPRQELRPKFLGYLLQNGLLVPEHFATEHESII